MDHFKYWLMMISAPVLLSDQILMYVYVCSIHRYLQCWTGFGTWLTQLFSLILTVTSSLFSSSSSQWWKRKRRPPSHSKKTFFYKKQSGIERLVLDKLDLRDFTLVRLSLRPPGEEFQLAFRRDGEWNPKAVTRCLKLRLLMPVSLGNLDLQWSPEGLVGAAVKLKF